MRELRELVRHRAKLVAVRSGIKAEVHAVLAKQGVLIPVTDLFGVGGRQLLEAVNLDAPYRARVHSQLPTRANGANTLCDERIPSGWTRRVGRTKNFAASPPD